MTRDVSLDVLRGMMLLIMAVDHFGEPLEKYTWQMFGFVTAAEGFVFLSGMLVGIVYSRYLSKQPSVLRKKVWDRAKVIYLYHMSALLGVFAFTVLSAWSDASWQSFAVEMEKQPLLTLLAGGFLLYLPPMLDVLPIYILFMLAAPAVLMLLHRGLAIWVLLGSFAIWAFAQFDGQKSLFSWLLFDDYIRMGAFDPFGWQLIFVLGIYIGHQRFLRNGELEPLNRMLWVVCLALVAFLFMQRHGFIHVQWLANYAHIDRESIAWLRLLNFLAMVYVIYGLIKAQVHFQIFRWFKWLGAWLAFLGRHSLQVFAFHLVVLYLYIPFRWGELAFSSEQKVFVLMAFVASLSIPAWLHERYQSAQRAKRKAENELRNEGKEQAAAVVNDLNEVITGSKMRFRTR